MTDHEILSILPTDKTEIDLAEILGAHIASSANNRLELRDAIKRLSSNRYIISVNYENLSFNDWAQYSIPAKITDKGIAFIGKVGYLEEPNQRETNHLAKRRAITDIIKKTARFILHHIMEILVAVIGTILAAFVLKYFFPGLLS